MERIDLEKFRNLVGNAKDYEIAGNVWNLKPLLVEDLPELYELSSKFQVDANTQKEIAKIQMDTNLSDEERAIKLQELTNFKLDKETVNIMIKLTTKTLENSYPEWDKDLIKRVSGMYFTNFLEAIYDLNLNVDGGKSAAEKIRKHWEKNDAAKQN